MKVVHIEFESTPLTRSAELMDYYKGWEARMFPWTVRINEWTVNDNGVRVPCLSVIECATEASALILFHTVQSIASPEKLISVELRNRNGDVIETA